MILKKYSKPVMLIAVFIAIIIALLFGIKLFKKVMTDKENNDLQTDMLLIQGKIKLLKGKAEVNKNEESYIGTKISSMEGNHELKDLLKNLKIEENKFEKYYVLNKEDLEKMFLSEELKNMEDNIFIVNYDETEVIYTKGLNINNGIKYRLSDIITKEPMKKWVLYNRIGDNR